VLRIALVAIVACAAAAGAIHVLVDYSGTIGRSYPDGRPVAIEGRPMGVAASPSTLDLTVKRANGTVTVTFDRGEWYVAGLERDLRGLDRIRVEGVVTVALDVKATDVTAPDALGRHRWDRMAVASETERSRLDAEWDAFRERASAIAPVPEAGIPRLTIG